MAAGPGATIVGAWRIAEQAAGGNEAESPQSPGGAAVSSMASTQVSPGRVEAGSSTGGSSAAGSGNAGVTAASANLAAAGGHARMETATRQVPTNDNKVCAVFT